MQKLALRNYGSNLHIANSLCKPNLNTCVHTDTGFSLRTTFTGKEIGPILYSLKLALAVKGDSGSAFEFIQGFVLM
jgi:hypothetical protein